MSFPDHLKIVVLSSVKQFKINETMVIENILDTKDVELSKMLGQTLKFSYELLTAEDGELGRRLPNDSWTGMFGMVLRGDADLVVSILALSGERSKFLDFTYPYYRGRLTFATRKPEYVPDPTVFLKPFSFEVWIYTLVSFILIALVFCKIFSRKYSLKKFILFCYSTVFCQGVSIQPQIISDFILITSWGVGAMLLSNCYSAVLLSFLTFPPLSGIRTIPELATAVVEGKYECTTYPGTFIPGALANSDDLNARIIGRNMMQNKGFANINDVLKKSIFSKKSAYIAGESLFKPFTAKYFVSNDEFLPTLQAIWMRKDFCCKERLNNFVSYLWSSGIYHKIVYNQIFKSSLVTLIHSDDISERENERQLTVDDFKGAFIILITGYALSITVFLFELILNRKFSFPLFNKNESV